MRQSILNALVRDGHRPIDEMIEAGNVYVILYLAHSPDAGDRMDFRDFCEWCQRARCLRYVKVYVACGCVHEAAEELHVPKRKLCVVLSWLVKNFPW